MATPTITDTKKQEDNSHQVTVPVQAAMGPAVTQSWPPEPDVELANILNCQRRINMPSPNEKGIRVVGWAISETDVGLGTTLLVLERIANLAQHARLTADVPSTLGARGSLENALDLLSERNRLREALEKYDAFVRDLCGGDFPSDIDGVALQEMLVEHGLYRVEPFDPAKHNDWSGAAEPGDDFYVPNHVAREALGAKQP